MSLAPPALGTGLLTSWGLQGRAGPSKDILLSELLSPSSPLPLGPLTLIIHLAHHGLQAVLLPRLVNGSSIQSDGVSFPGLLGTGGSVQPGPRGTQPGAQGHLLRAP